MPNLPKPLHVYSYPTPNGLSVPIYLNELKRVYPNLDYDFTNIDSEEGVKQVPWFVNVNPNASIPALVDVKRGNFAVFETSAILLYIAQHYDPDYHFWFSSSEDPDDYSQMLQWLFWAHGGLDPMQRQAAEFFGNSSDEDSKKRYCDEASRIYGVLEARLENRDFVAGHGRGKYTIADMKMLPWIREHKDVGIDLKDFPNIQRCAEQCMSREGTKTGLRVGLDEVK
ncbi:mitochondrial protein [Coprinopsis cinerea AmutBmut pab1-1]|nr:mitochondrial protein [Coprinopsis cinerea AmutBmut pab1-1]